MDMNNVIITTEDNIFYIDEEKILGTVVTNGVVEVHFETEDDAFEHSHLSIS